MKFLKSFTQSLNFSSWTLIFLLPLFIPLGCNQSENHGLREGKIIYDVVFESEQLNPMIKALLPSEITTYFNNNKTCTVISMKMKMMETRLISDSKTFHYTTLVSAMGKKVAMVMDKEQVQKNYIDRVDLQVRKTGEIKEIAGIKCFQAIVTDSTENTYPVYYTDAVSITNPNWSSPFRDIEGVMMEYTISFGNMTMKLKAKEIVAVKSDSSLFEIPSDYTIIEDPESLDFSL
jgi:hypothetical protein